MIDADAIHAALEEMEQDALRKQFRAMCENGPKHYVSDSDTFDRIAGGMIVRRNNHVTPLLVVPEGEYGS
jgi:hypothetical protein